jgi:hypothetical protein
MSGIHTARCLCGAVRIAIAGEPVGARACWCRLCQYLASGNATVNVAFASDAVSVEGEVRWYASVADSGNRMQRGFCPTCGTPLFSKSDARPDRVMIRAGALDDPGIAAPQSLIWVSEAPDWACLDPALPHVERQPPPIA